MCELKRRLEVQEEHVNKPPPEKEICSRKRRERERGGGGPGGQSILRWFDISTTVDSEVFLKWCNGCQ